MAILLSAFFSCSRSGDEGAVPQGIIVPDSMVQILTDIHIAESRLLLSGAGQDAVLPKKAYIHEVLVNHGVDSAAFYNSFIYYTDHPHRFAAMYEEVINEISKKQAEANKSEAKDSIP